MPSKIFLERRVVIKRVTCSLVQARQETRAVNYIVTSTLFITVASKRFFCSYKQRDMTGQNFQKLKPQERRKKKKKVALVGVHSSRSKSN